MGIDVYLCHQQITFKYPNSRESPLPAPLQHRRKLKIRAAGNAKEDTHSFVHWFIQSFFHSPIPGSPCSPRRWMRGCRLPSAGWEAPSARTARIITKGCFSRPVISPCMTLCKGTLTAIFTKSLCRDW